MGDGARFIPRCEKGRMDRGRVEENRERERERGGGREREIEREIEEDSRGRLSSGVQQERLIRSRLIDDRLGKKIVSSYVASCQPLGRGEGREGRTDGRKSHNSSLSVILDWTFVGLR